MHYQTAIGRLQLQQVEQSWEYTSSDTLLKKKNNNKYQQVEGTSYTR